MCDLDGNGILSKEELGLIANNFFHLIGSTYLSFFIFLSFHFLYYYVVSFYLIVRKKKYESPAQFVDEFFTKININGDGKITLKEFKEGAFIHPDLFSVFQTFDTGVNGMLLITI